MEEEQYEIKVKRIDNRGTPWEDLPVAHTLPESEARAKAREIAEESDCWEVRLNKEGYPEGEYRPGRKARWWERDDEPLPVEYPRGKSVLFKS